MCYTMSLPESVEALLGVFGAIFPQSEDYSPGVKNGFQHPAVPVITNNHPEEIHLYQWGLIPHWARDDNLKKSTLNARIETINEKPSFRSSVKNRCLILVDGFFEWQWLDSKGKQKQKFLLSMPDGEPFALGGLWSHWTDPRTGQEIPTCTVLTMEARGLMLEIHNTRKRMPVIMTRENCRDWLVGGLLQDDSDAIVATPLSE